MTLSTYDACKLITNDIGMTMNPDEILDVFKNMCVQQMFTKFTCDVIVSNWNELWKQFIVNFISGAYCEKIFH